MPNDGSVTPERRIPALALTNAKPMTTTPTSRRRVGRIVLGTTTGSPARASSPGAVPIAKIAMMAPAKSGDPVESA